MIVLEEGLYRLDLKMAQEGWKVAEFVSCDKECPCISYCATPVCLSAILSSWHNIASAAHWCGQWISLNYNLNVTDKHWGSASQTSFDMISIFIYSMWTLQSCSDMLQVWKIKSLSGGFYFIMPPEVCENITKLYRLQHMCYLQLGILPF